MSQPEGNAPVGFVTGLDKMVVPDAHVSFAKCEQDVLEYWDKINAFETSLKMSEGKKPYVFYDGPPFATGLPHYGHILAGTIKDIVTRYAHQTGHYFVARKGGFDCHGLPVEYEIDKKLNIKSKDDVMRMGVAAYNEECRSIVLRYTDEWRKTIRRLGRWIDLENPYKTMDMSFMESVWWVFKQLYEKDLVYRGFKVMPYSTTCTTPLSNFEAGQNYKTVKDPSVVVSFPIKGDADNASLVAWTTTPWTLPSNLALCVNPSMTYVRVKDLKTGNVYVMAKPRMEMLFTMPKKPTVHNAQNLTKPEQQALKEQWINSFPSKTDKYEILAEMTGKDLAGLHYEPLFTYFADKWTNTAFRVIADDYVTDDSGTGIVHCAPAFGEDDYRVCIVNGIMQKGGDLLCPVDENGRYTADVVDFAGKYVKDADKDVIANLKAQKKVLVHQQYEHSYPYCWRSDTPLIYKAVPSWFVAVEKIKEDLVRNNEQTYWVPTAVQEGRFANWLKDARDWAISRSRYWGTPIPIWMSADGKEIKVIGSVAELEELTGATGVTDIHKHFIDHLTIPDPRGAEYPPMKRIEEVFDCWFESGSMPYAQLHYPFENKEVFEEGFPAEFIAEGLDQTRGWFYTLMVISTALYNKPAFKNLIVNGLVLAADGKKMSKSLKNYPDPEIVVNKYGADALRLYLINSPVVRAESVAFKEDGVLNIVKKVILPWWNAFRFAVENIIRYTDDSGKAFTVDLSVLSSAENVMDKWILASLQTLVEEVRVEMGAYRLYTVVPLLLKFIEQLTNWYVRANRRRIKGQANTEKDRHQALSTLAYVLYSLCRLMAPMTPFITETMYQHLRVALPASEHADSIHYLTIPEPVSEAKNAAVESAIKSLQRVVELGRTCRDNRNIGLKMPLKTLVVASTSQALLDELSNLEEYLKEELNVREVVYENKPVKYVRPVVIANPRAMARKLGKKFKEVAAALAALEPEAVDAFQASGSVTVLDEVVSFEDVAVEVKASDNTANSSLELAFEGNVVAVLDCNIDRDFAIEGLAREVVNRVQRLRKAAGLLPQDKVVAYYTLPATELTADAIALSEVLTASGDFIAANLTCELKPASEQPADASVIKSEEFDVSEQPILLTIAWAKKD